MSACCLRSRLKTAHPTQPDKSAMSTRAFEVVGNRVVYVIGSVPGPEIGNDRSSRRSEIVTILPSRHQGLRAQEALICSSLGPCDRYLTALLTLLSAQPFSARFVILGRKVYSAMFDRGCGVLILRKIHTIKIMNPIEIEAIYLYNSLFSS